MIQKSYTIAAIITATQASQTEQYWRSLAERRRMLHLNET